MPKKLYKLTFISVDKEYNPERKYAKKINKTSADDKLYLTPEGDITVIEDDIKKYWMYGGGIESMKFVGEISDSYFNPQLSEQKFVDEIIMSRKNDDIVGYQG